ncbi:MAG: GFA family protein [Paracoccaceae bacterium]|nr:GFA family protein [Paracoccaceae bacterium]MDE3120934.1 GFA family protein [Paracoccaceae bacterium]MDE3238286.1 GFA family protein [Paracoccaceae bacterium]
MAEIVGQCLCGAVHYRIDATPVFAAACHCRDCQYVSGGAESNVLIVPAAALRVEGQVRRYESLADSGARVWRSFCPDCGTPLFAGNADHGEVVAVKAGSLADPATFRRQAHIWTGSAPPWHLMEEDLPRFPANPPLG